MHKLKDREERITEYLRIAGQEPGLFSNPSAGAIFILLDLEDILRAEAEEAKQLRDLRLPEVWREVGKVYEDEYLRILRDAVRFPSGRLGTYSRILPKSEDGAGVAVLPLFDGKILLLNHFRHATRSWHLEVPRGFHKRGFTPENDAKSELEEETGAVVRSLTSLGRMHVNTGIMSDHVELFFGILESVGNPEIEEGIRDFRLADLAEFERLIRTSEITDSFTIASYARAKLAGLL